MRARKLRLILPLVGAAAMAAMYVGVFHLSDSVETVPGIDNAHSVTGKTSGGNAVNLPPASLVSEDTGRGRTGFLESELQPREIRRSSSNWSRCVASFDDDFSAGSDDLAGRHAPAPDTGAQTESPGRGRIASARGAYSSKRGGGGSGGGGGGGGMSFGRLGSGIDEEGAPESFFLVADDNRTLPRFDDPPAGLPGPGNESAPDGAGSNPDSGNSPFTVTGSTGNQVIPLGLTTSGGESGDDLDGPGDPSSDQRTSVKVPDNASTLGLLALSILGLAGLRRRMAR